MTRRIPERTPLPPAVVVPLALGALLLAGVVGALFFRRPNSSMVTSVVASWTLKPEWNEELTSSNAQAPADSMRLAIFLDVSEPMGGFLAPHGSNERSVLASVLRSLPAQMVQVSTHATSAPEWFAVDSSVRRISAPDVIELSLFRGAESRLDLAIGEIHAGLRDGRWQMAVLVSDLVATQDLRGAMGTAGALRAYTNSGPARSGRAHLAIRAWRAPYWGVPNRHCGADHQRCRFSEHAQSWLPLPPDPRVPLHVLGFDSSASRIERLLSATDEALKELLPATPAGSELSHGELLTKMALTEVFEGRCTFGMPANGSGPATSDKQFALAIDPDGRSRCLRDDDVAVTCDVPVPGYRLIAGSVCANWPAVRPDSLTDERAVFRLACSDLTRKWPKEPLVLTLTAVPVESELSSWAAWSSHDDTSSDQLDRTLQLRELIATVRLKPPRVILTSGPLLRGRP